MITPAALGQAANLEETLAKRVYVPLESKYKALPEEADAFAVQADIKHLYLVPS